MKHLYQLVVSLLLFAGFQSCIDEDGAGVPSPKSLVIEAEEYTLDTTAPTAPGHIVFRWVDVGNATYSIAFTQASKIGEDPVKLTAVLDNEVTTDPELDVLNITITKAQLVDFLTQAGIVQAGTYDVVVSLIATPADPTLPTTLAPKGSVKSATIHVTI